MDSADLTAWAAIITAITGPTALVMVAHLTRKVTHIDHAVNGKPPGDQSMVSQVSDIHGEVVPPKRGPKPDPDPTPG